MMKNQRKKPLIEAMMIKSAAKIRHFFVFEDKTGNDITAIWLFVIKINKNRYYSSYGDAYGLPYGK